MLHENVSSPMVIMESMMLTAVIDTEENREVATCDIPNAFIQTEVEEHDSKSNWTILKIRGVLADLMCKISPSYAAVVQE
jgi:hypothetical protein